MLFISFRHHKGVKLRKFKNRRNNICLIALLDGRSFSRWHTFLKMFEILASILINSNCLLQPIKTCKTWPLANKNPLLKVIICTAKVGFDYIILMWTLDESTVRFYHFAGKRSDRNFLIFDWLGKKKEIFRHLGGWVKNCHIPHVIFGTTYPILFKLCITL